MKIKKGVFCHLYSRLSSCFSIFMFCCWSYIIFSTRIFQFESFAGVVLVNTSNYWYYIIYRFLCQWIIFFAR